MKVEIYNDCEEKKEKVLRLALKKTESGKSVKLCAVDENGETLQGGNLLVLDEDGTFRRVGGLCNIPHLKVGAYRKIVIK